MSILLDVIFTAIEILGILYLVKNEKVKTLNKVLFFIIQISFVFFLTHTFDLQQINMKILVIFLVLLFLGVTVLNLSITKVFFYMGIWTLLLLLSEIVVMQVALLMNRKPGDGFTIAFGQNIVSKILFISFIIIVQKIISDIGAHRLKWKSMVLFILSYMCYIIVAICINVAIISMQNTIDTKSFLACSIIMFLVLIINALVSNKYALLEERDKIQNLTIYKLELQEKYYIDKLKEEEKIKQIYHDLKNHILILEEAAEGEAQQLCDIARIKKEIIKYEDYFRTGNKFLDIILKEKKKIALEHNIVLEDSIDISRGNFIEALDISAIFGNLIDNATEACKLIDDNAERYIKISSKSENNMLIISVRNSMNQKIIKSILKPRKIINGYGLINISNAVHKYDGELDIIKGDGEFVVNIVIPIKGERDETDDSKVTG